MIRLVKPRAASSRDPQAISSHLVVLMVLAAVVTGSCAVHGLQLTRDTRVHIDSPLPEARITLPLRLRWHASGDLPPTTRFAVFIDREPMPPGKDVHWLGDASCKRTPACPDATYLADRYIYITPRTELTLDALPMTIGSGTKVQARGFHEATIVLIDSHDRRFDEASYTVAFSAGNR